MANMTLIKDLIKTGDFVIVPRKEYEVLLRSRLDEDLARAMLEVRQGKVIGPFDNVKDLMKSLNSR
jgi:hypothetical protein